MIDLLLGLLVLELDLHTWPFLDPKDGLGLFAQGVDHVDGGDFSRDLTHWLDMRRLLLVVAMNALLVFQIYPRTFTILLQKTYALRLRLVLGVAASSRHLTGVGDRAYWLCERH